MLEDRCRPALLTIGTCNHQARIALVVESFLRHHPAGQIFICLVDRPKQGMSLALPGTILSAEELDLPGGRRFLFKYEAFELCCALKPYAINYVMQRHAISHLVYLDADILVMKNFWGDLELAWTNHSILLTPHLTRLPGNTSAEFQRSLVQHGAYNGGFIALKIGNETNQFLDCWASLLADGCTFDPMNNIYVDQRWLDLLVPSCESVGVLRDSSLNVAYWNLHERRLTVDDQGEWTVNGLPLKFFHFSGFDRTRLTTKMKCLDAAALAIARYYGDLLEQAGEEQFRTQPYGWDYYVDGTPILLAHRDMILAHHPEFADVTDPFGLPQMPDKWQAFERLASVLSPVRLAHRYRHPAKAEDLLQRLYRHPVVGIVWKLWSRFVNQSLRPPHV
jgi:hypothetical protein